MADHSNNRSTGRGGIPDPIITLAMERFKTTAEAEFEGRKAAKDDMEFYVSNQWPDQISQDRQTDGRPCLTINRLPQFVRQVTNDQRMNRPSVKVIPVEDSDENVAKIYEGLVRHIQEASQADIAYDTACQTQVICGRGFFRIITDYCNEENFDQDILIKRIKNPLTVYVDPASIEPDYSDARFMFIVEDLSKEEFKSMYPKAEVISDTSFMSRGDGASTWATEKAMRIAEYFTVEDEVKKLYQLASGEIVAEVPEGEEAVKEREAVTKKVIWRKISCVEVLEEKDWAGKYIPIIPVLGDDLDVDGKRYIKGMVRDAKDSQRMYNYWASAQTEAIALAPKAPFIAAEGQIEGYEAMWAAANTKNYAVLPYKPRTIDGTQVPAPQRITAEPPVQAMVQAMKQAGDDMKAITGIYDASLGARSNETSGKAITARQKSGDVANYHYVDNLGRSIRHLGRCLIDLIPKIYDAPRVVRILGEDGEGANVPINQPTSGADGVNQIYDVTSGKYDVVVETGPSFETKRQETADAMATVLQANPELWQVAGDIFVKSLDWPNADKLAERMKKMLPPQLQDNANPIPPQVQQQLDQSKQMIQQLTEALHAEKDKNESKQAEMESKEAMNAENNSTKLLIAEMQNNFGAFKEDLAHLRAHLDRELAQEEMEKSQALDNAQASDTMGGMNSQEAPNAELTAGVSG
jgi:hypothetical protein